jgi:hypothetical protein
MSTALQQQRWRLLSVVGEEVAHVQSDKQKADKPFIDSLSAVNLLPFAAQKIHELDSPSPS